MRRKKIKRMAWLLAAAMLTGSTLPYSADIVSAKGNGNASSPKEAKEKWEFSVNQDIPLDKVCSYASSGSEGNGYYFGIKNGKTAVIDENLQCHINAEFDGIEDEEYWCGSDDAYEYGPDSPDFEENLIIKGKPARVAYKDVVVEDGDDEDERYEERYYGIISCMGETLVEPRFNRIGIMLDSEYLILETDEGIGIWNSKLEELLPCQYDQVGNHYIDACDDEDDEGNTVISAYNKKEMAVLFNQKVIWRKKNGMEVKRYAKFDLRACFADYERKDCIGITLDVHQDGQDDSESKHYYKYIAYDGTELSDWLDEGQRDKKIEEENKKQEEENELWIAEQCKEDEKEVAAFFKEKGVNLSNIKTSYKIQEPGKYNDYNYWIIISAEYDSSRNKSNSELTYVLIYNKDRERLVAGRSFGQDNEDDPYFNYATENFYECLVFLTNDGELCCLLQDRIYYSSKIVSLCKIDESDGLTYLYIKDMSDSGKGNDIHTEPHQLYFEKTGDNDLGRYVEVKLVEGAFQETRHDYWINYFRGDFYEGTHIVDIYDGYYFVENADAGIDIYWRGIAKDDFIGHLDCSADTFKQIKIEKINWREDDADDEEPDQYLLCLWCDEHKKVTFLRWDRYCQAGYGELGISGCLPEGFEGSRVLWYGWSSGPYVIKVDDVYLYLKLNEGKEFKLLSAIDEATAKYFIDIGHNIHDIENEDQMSDKEIYWVKKEKSVDIIMSDSSGVTIKNVPTNGWDISLVYAVGNKLFILYKNDSGYGILDMQGKDQGLSGSGAICLVGDYMIQDEILYDLSRHPIANHVAVDGSCFSVANGGYRYYDGYCVIASKDKSSGFKPLVVNVDKADNSYRLPDNIFVCDDLDEDIRIRSDVYSIANGFSVIHMRAENGQKRTLVLDESDRVVFYGDAYIYLDSKTHKITAYGKNMWEKEPSTSSPTSIPTSIPNYSYIYPVSPTPTSSPAITPEPTVSPSVIPTATPEPTDEPTATPDVTPSGEPLATPEPSIEPEPSAPAVDDSNAAQDLKRGTMVSDRKTKTVYKVSGTGRRKAVEYVRSTKSNVSKITIPAKVKLRGQNYKVTSIGKNAFRNNKKLKNVSMGKNVKKIGSQAFSGCKKLKKIVIGKNVTTIEANAFKGCSDLTMVTIPSKVKKIGAKAFYQCKNLRYIMVKTKKLTPDNVGKDAFSGGYRLPRVKTDKNIWRKYSRIFLKNGISKKALFIINPVKLVI